MVDAVDRRVAFRHQAGDDEAGRRAQVRGHHGSALELVHAFDGRGLAIEMDVRTEPGDVFEISEPQFGLPLTNSVARDKAEKVKIKAL